MVRSLRSLRALQRDSTQRWGIGVNPMVGGEAGRDLNVTRTSEMCSEFILDWELGLIAACNLGRFVVASWSHYPNGHDNIELMRFVRVNILVVGKRRKPEEEDMQLGGYNHAQTFRCLRATLGFEARAA